MVVFPEAGGPNITIFGTVGEKDLNVTARNDRATSGGGGAGGVPRCSGGIHVLPPPDVIFCQRQARL